MFERVPLPTPFHVGTVNAYVAGRTVVDPGPDSEETREALRDALAERDLAPADVAQVLITHPHPDHFGLAAFLREHGASVVASPEAATVVRDFPGRLDDEQAFLSDFFRRCGMAAGTAETVTQLPEAFVHYAPSVSVDREVSAGDTVWVGRDDPTVEEREVTVREVTGHAVGEVVFAFDGAAGREALVGDNVMAEITPNPFLQPPPEPGAERPRVLPAYNESLRRLREVGYDRFHPGHRGAVDDPAGRIDAILAEHDERTDRVAAMLDEPTTPVAVMNGLFDDLPVTEQFPGMSEAVGHLDVLVARDRAVAHERDGTLSYERA